MKKRIFLSMLFALVLGISASDAFALNCLSSIKAGGSDECWSQVRVAPEETYVVSKGTVLVYDFTSSASSDESAGQVRVATSAEQGYRVAGVAQSVITSGDLGHVLVRGKGTILANSTASSGDRLWASSTPGYADDVAPTASSDGVIAFALETISAKGEADAFITIV